MKQKISYSCKYSFLWILNMWTSCHKSQNFIRFISALHAWDGRNSNFRNLNCCQRKFSNLLLTNIILNKSTFRIYFLYVCHKSWKSILVNNIFSSGKKISVWKSLESDKRLPVILRIAHFRKQFFQIFYNFIESGYLVI